MRFEGRPSLTQRGWNKSEYRVANRTTSTSSLLTLTYLRTENVLSTDPRLGPVTQSVPPGVPIRSSTTKTS